MKLSEYYREVVDINDSLKGGWAKAYYGIFSQVIEENQYKNVAEVGIGYGTHAKFIMKSTTVEKLYLIDPMQFYENDGFASDIRAKEADISGNNFNELYQLIQMELSPWKDRLEFLRVPSLAVTDEMIPDGSLDCVFVDGDHSFRAVFADLQFWWKKIRPGGQMLGDDWWMDDVKRAVFTFANEERLAFDFLEKQGEDYKIFRFKKL
jgi:hypothetical protein